MSKKQIFDGILTPKMLKELVTNLVRINLVQAILNDLGYNYNFYFFDSKDSKSNSDENDKTSFTEDIKVYSKGKITINKLNIPYKKRILNVGAGVLLALNLGTRNFANAKDKNFTKTSEIHCSITSQRTQVIDVDNPDNQSTLNFTPKSFLTRKPQRTETRELEAKGKIIVEQRDFMLKFHKQLTVCNSQLEKEKEKALIIVNQNNPNKEKFKKLEIIQRQNIENVIRYSNTFPKTDTVCVEQKWLRFANVPKINHSKQIDKQLKKESVKAETFKRNLIKFQNGQRKHYSLNTLIILLLPTLETLYPIFCVNDKNKKKTKLINAVQKINFNPNIEPKIKGFREFREFNQRLEKSIYINKLVENYRTIMLFSIFMSAFQLKFNSAGRLVHVSEPFISVETQIEEWIMQNKILVCLIIFSTVTILTMKVLNHISINMSNKQEYFLYLLKAVEILRKEFILPNLLKSLKELGLLGKDILLYVLLDFLYNFMIYELAQPVIDPVTNPVTDLVTNPVTNPVTDLVTNPVTDPVPDPVTDRVTVEFILHFGY